MQPHNTPPEVREALAPLVQWIVAIVLETAATQAKGSEGPRYYDAKNAPMGKTAFLRLAAQGAFPSFKVGKRVRAKADDVHAYIERQQGAKCRPHSGAGVYHCNRSCNKEKAKAGFCEPKVY